MSGKRIPEDVAARNRRMRNILLGLVIAFFLFSVLWVGAIWKP